MDNGRTAEGNEPHKEDTTRTCEAAGKAQVHEVADSRGSVVVVHAES